MNVCVCGRFTNGGRPACDRCTALAVFELPRDATQTEIKGAYRVLAKVWHPDRFQNDEQLRRKAEEKLREINSAYQVLTTAEGNDAYRQSSRPTAPEEDFPQAAASEERPQRAASTTHFNATVRITRRTSRRWLVIPAAILAAGGFWITLRYMPPALGDFGSATTTDRSATRQTSGPVMDNSQAETSENGDRAGAAGRGSKEQPATNDSTSPPDKSGVHARTTAASSGASVVVYPHDDPLVPYFTVGSTKDDVVRVQGPPDTVTGNVLKYGVSEVYLKNGRVESWHIDPSTPLKASMP
jgi:curved DNA-binding protein CbpA